MQVNTLGSGISYMHCSTSLNALVAVWSAGGTDYGKTCQGDHLSKKTTETRIKGCYFQSKDPG